MPMLFMQYSFNLSRKVVFNMERVGKNQDSYVTVRKNAWSFGRSLFKGASGAKW